MKTITRLLLCLMISFTLVEIPLMKAEAHAGLISTRDALDLVKRSESEKTVSDFLGRSDVKEQLIKMGVNPEDAHKRIAGLSDSEVRKLSSDIDQAVIGGDLGGILVLVLVVILIIYFARRI